MFSLLRLVWFSAVILYCLPAQAQRVLRYRFDKSKPLYYEITAQVEQKIEANGQTLSTSIETRDISQWTAKEVTSSGEAVLEKKPLLLQLSQTMKGPFGERTFRFDSTKPPPQPQNPAEKFLVQILQNQAKIPLEFRIDSRGRISQVRGIDDWLKGVQAPGPMKKLLEDTLAQSQKQAKSLFVSLPEKAPKVGDQWEEPFEFKLGPLGTVKGKVVRRYEGTQGSVARIGQQTFLEGKLDTRPVPGIHISGAFKTTRSQGHVLFDVAQGRVLSSKEEFQIRFEIDVQAQNQAQKMQQTMVTKQTLRLLDGPPKLPQGGQESP